MSDRRTPLRIPSVSAPPLGGDLAGMARLLANYPPLYGRMVACTLDGSGAAQYFRHGLNRRFVGVQYWGGGSTVTLFGYSSPELVEAAGVDSKVYFRVNPDSATSETFNFWVF
jgi:hypothetical protein